MPEPIFLSRRRATGSLMLDERDLPETLLTADRTTTAPADIIDKANEALAVVAAELLSNGTDYKEAATRLARSHPKLLKLSKCERVQGANADIQVTSEIR